MARHKFTAEQRKKGVLKALASPRTPAKLKEGLRRHAKKAGYI